MPLDLNKSLCSNTLFYLFQLTLAQSYAASYQNPSHIFPTTDNKITPSIYWLEQKKPFPTNAWFINLVLGQANNEPSNAVNIFPYSLKINSRGLSLSYTEPSFYSESSSLSIISAFYYQFDKQLSLGPSEPMNHYGLASFHGLSINLEWQEGAHKMSAPILQGSPYLTAFFTQSRPQLSTDFKIKSINQQTSKGLLAKMQRYELVLALNEQDTQTWILYAEKPIFFNWTTQGQEERVSATEDYTGWLRLVLQKDTRKGLENDVALLNAYSQNIPLDYQQSYYFRDQSLVYSLRWKTQNAKPPLMLSLPHQRTTGRKQSPSVSYSGIKGRLEGETKQQWDIELPLIPILFLEPKSLSSEERKLLETSLESDAKNLLEGPFPDDSVYQVGKRYARSARLILIASYLKKASLQKQMLAFIETQLRKKMLAESNWYFQYDTTWGGIIPSQDDYGARHYNDHHFHYGYWVYTFAVIALLDADWLNQPVKPKLFTPKDWIDSLIRDYANEDRHDPYFPAQRYQDDYAGHSWASGLTAFVDGQNQQSSSEAVNAYYAIALYALALKDQKLLKWSQFLMTRELVSAQTYWQIRKDSAIYPEQFKKYNQVVANLWDNKIDANAFFIQCDTEFRCGLEYSFGIEMLPFTAITSALLNKQWLKEIAPTIKKMLKEEPPSIKPAWQWILVKGIAPTLEKKEKEFFLNRLRNSKPEDFDHGDSKTNSLYFLM